MTRFCKAVAIGTGVVAMAFVAGCSSQPSSTDPAASSIGATSAPGGSATVDFTSVPAAPTTGENTFEVTVTQDGRPVDDAAVSVEFFMAAMPAMNMAEMRTKADLASEGAGRYRGTGQIMMAGKWDVTITAARNGQQLARRTLTVTAR